MSYSPNKQGQAVYKTAKKCRQRERHTDKQKTKSRETENQKINRKTEQIFRGAPFMKTCAGRSPKSRYPCYLMTLQRYTSKHDIVEFSSQ